MEVKKPNQTFAFDGDKEKNKFKRCGRCDWELRFRSNYCPACGISLQGNEILEQPQPKEEKKKEEKKTSEKLNFLKKFREKKNNEIKNFYKKTN